MGLVVDERVVRASFRGCSLSDRKNFPVSSCLMPISVGQKVHEGKKLEATIDLVNRSFKRCTILIDDSLQRHTLMINCPVSEDESYQLAIRLGNEWLDRNRMLYQKLDIPYKLIRWNKWLQHDSFSEMHKKVNQLFHNDASYNRAMQDNAHKFLYRYAERHKRFDYGYAFSKCINYLLEECTSMCLWTEENCEFELYPTGRNRAMSATYNGLSDLIIQTC